MSNGLNNLYEFEEFRFEAETCTLWRGAAKSYPYRRRLPVCSECWLRAKADSSPSRKF